MKNLWKKYRATRPSKNWRNRIRGELSAIFNLSLVDTIGKIKQISARLNTFFVISEVQCNDDDGGCVDSGICTFNRSSSSWNHEHTQNNRLIKNWIAEGSSPALITSTNPAVLHDSSFV